MDDKDWPLTSKAIADSERANQGGEYDLTDDEEPVAGNRLLRELLADGVAEQVTPGRYWVSKLRPDRDKPS